jgi:hydrogenase nickel incorporation protein HypB
MCTTCGCSDDATPTFTNMQTGHSHVRHEHGQAYGHEHDSHPTGTVVRVHQEILAKNNRFGERNRGWLLSRGILALNLVSAPGAGKTTLLERTLCDMRDELSFQVVEGDQATLNDGRRIQATGCPVVQINTGTGCHLDAAMLARGLQTLNPQPHSVVLVENVGNLVCPALFDLGEWAKVLVCSVTDGDDKPMKYPHMFRASALVLLNKMDLLAHVSFDLERFSDHVRQVNPGLPILLVSATCGDGLAAWYAWLQEQKRQQLEAISCSQEIPHHG